MQFCLLKKLLLFSLLTFFSSCSSNNTNNLSNAWDPIEPVNRAIFSFNIFVDTYTLEPIAKAYNFVMPEFASNSLRNHFDWIKTPLSTINSFLQGKGDEAFDSITHFSVNILTLGFYDLTGNKEIKTSEDFDQTLGVYKIGTGPYIILPFLGPSTFRGLAGTVLDGFIDPLNLLDTEKVVRINSAELPIKAVSTRAEYMEQINDLKYNSLDAYSVFRSVYFQKLLSDTNDVLSNDNNTDLNSGAVDAFFIQNK